MSKTTTQHERRARLTLVGEARIGASMYLLSVVSSSLRVQMRHDSAVSSPDLVDGRWRVIYTAYSREPHQLREPVVIE